MRIVVLDKCITIVPLDDEWTTNISSGIIHFYIFNNHCYSGHPETQTTPINCNNPPSAKIEIPQLFLCQTLHLFHCQTFAFISYQSSLKQSN